ncbi:MAG: M23 family metallopeptidase, partial [Bacillota bacterium]
MKVNLKRGLLLTLVIILLLMSSASYAQRSNKEVEVYYQEVESGKYEFYARNHNYAPYQIKLSFKQLKNMQIDVSLPYYTVINPQVEKQYLFTAQAQQSKRYNFSYQYQYSIGDPQEAAPDDYAYLLPYRHGEKHRVTQGYNGSYSHQGTLALDFKMEKGTPVTAARDGKVVKVKEDSNIGGASQRYNNYANYITIYHQDGTFAKYVHLKYSGAIVTEGEEVEAGQVIGYSGNTGWSQGPHLHFEVFKPINMG